MTPTKEQMELAARAAGIKQVKWHDALYCMYVLRPKKPKHDWVEWTPLTSGDDSQRLQVKLGMTASVGATTVDACCWTDREELTRTINKALLFDPAIPDDDLRAMREAIFLVAVEIGRAK